MLRLLFAGFGTVGQGLAELLLEGKESLARECGLEYRVVGISDMLKGSVYDPDGVDLERALEAVKNGGSLNDLPRAWTGGDTLAFIQSANADVLLEATYTDIKTGEPATAHIKAALDRGMHVVTSNKGPLALNYHELSALARKRNRHFLFEGTVMSGTPCLNLLRECLAGSGIQEIKGILNGTTNYILTRMEEGLSYEDALKKAQELGYAEAVPDADVLGWDALAKVTILANVVFGATKKPFEYPCQGITEITAEAIAKAKKEHKRYKLIGRVWKEGDEVKASVAPQEIPISHPLAGVMGAVNAATVTSAAMGEVTIVGKGAGRKETGFSLLIDLIHIARRR
jgi:homoserine dehydrogenase